MKWIYKDDYTLRSVKAIEEGFGRSQVVVVKIENTNHIVLGIHSTVLKKHNWYMGVPPWPNDEDSGLLLLLPGFSPWLGNWGPASCRAPAEKQKTPDTISESCIFDFYKI